MITEEQFMRAAAMRLLRGMVPLTLTAFGAFLLAGCAPAPTGFSLLLGACYATLLFRMVGKSAAKAAQFPPALASRMVRRGYLFRYVLTGMMVYAAIQTPFIQPVAAILPLFFPKAILLWSIQSRGKEVGR